jgi:hypothetical protein
MSVARVYDFFSYIGKSSSLTFLFHIFTLWMQMDECRISWKIMWYFYNLFYGTLVSGDLGEAIR